MNTAENRFPPKAIEHTSLHQWQDCLHNLLRHFGIDAGALQELVSNWNCENETVEESVLGVSSQLGLVARYIPFDRHLISENRLPLIVALDCGDVAYIASAVDADTVNVVYDGCHGVSTPVSIKLIESGVTHCLLARPASGAESDTRAAYLEMPKKGLLSRFILADRASIITIIMASLLANTMAMAGVLFSMQVYDRVIPAESLNTLYVLFIGVSIAAVFDFMMRLMRIRLSDVIGKIVDYRLSDLVYGRAVRVRNDARPKSTGAFISQLRDIDQIREMVSSTSLSVIADIPFFFLFLFVFGYIAGPLVYIPLAALFAILIPGILMQGRLARLSREVMHDAALRNTLIVETVQGLDDIKSAQAEGYFHNKWNRYNEETATANLRLRSVVNGLAAWTQTVQTTVFAVVVLFGAPMVMSGEMTTGVLVAASILASRMLAPMSSVSQLLSRWQHARAAKDSIDQIAGLPSDIDNLNECVRKPVLKGHYVLQKANFRYEKELGRPALYIDALEIKAGERIAVLGRNGSGKSTLLQALAGLMQPVDGLVSVDGVRMSNIAVSDIRKNIGWASQSASLFYGSIRENIVLGSGPFDDDQIIAALQATGAMDFINKLERGLEHRIHEGGKGLSEGQKKSILLARTLVRNPRVLLLDEPCASLDELAERRLLESLLTQQGHRTLVISTHKMSTLEMVDRVIVLNDGKLVMDEPRDSAIKKIVRIRQLGAGS